MGQRHQIIVVLPEVYYNENNPNNRPVKAGVIHHQWLYGFNAVFALERALKLAYNSVAKYDCDLNRDYLFGRGGSSSRDAIEAVSRAISVDPETGYFHETHVWESADWNGMDHSNLVEPQKLDPDMFDNNDGVTIIVFDKGELFPRVCFATPGHVEGNYWNKASGFGPWSPKEYLNFYYTDEQITESKDIQLSIEKSLTSIDSLSRPLTPEDVSALLPKFPFRSRKKVESNDVVTTEPVLAIAPKAKGRPKGSKNKPKGKPTLLDKARAIGLVK